MEDKFDALVRVLTGCAPVGIGYSGGVDSAFLAAVCARHLPDRATLIHLNMPFAGTPEREAYVRDTARFGLPVIEIACDPLEDPRIAANPPERCYLCKRAGFSAIVHAARERGLKTIVDGSNADDEGDYRPGMRALRELDVRSPLMETGWRKREERELLRAWGYEVWNMPAGACLATRIPSGETLSRTKLELIRAGEDALHAAGARQVRVRLMGGTARVEASADDLARMEIEAGSPLPADIVRLLHQAGIASIDPVAHLYAHGSMNAAR